MPSDPQAKLPQRVLTVIFAVAVGIAMVGFVAGTRPARRLTRSSPERAARPPAGQARSYSELRSVRLGRARPEELVGLEKAVPRAIPQKAPTAAQRKAAVDARSRRRAFDGAPPVIPHGITQKSSASCLTCHRKGAVVNNKVAPALPHPPYTSCTQCHVPSQGIGKNNMPRAGNSFVGLRSSGKGRRDSLGAPPSIPHSTWMRSNCLACHGPAGKPGLRTPHPQRKSCEQCHAPDQRRQPTEGVPR